MKHGDVLFRAIRHCNNLLRFFRGKVHVVLVVVAHRLGSTRLSREAANLAAFRSRTWTVFLFVFFSPLSFSSSYPPSLLRRLAPRSAIVPFAVALWSFYSFIRSEGSRLIIHRGSPASSCPRVRASILFRFCSVWSLTSNRAFLSLFRARFASLLAEEDEKVVGRWGMPSRMLAGSY